LTTSGQQNLCVDQHNCEDRGDGSFLTIDFLFAFFVLTTLRAAVIVSDRRQPLRRFSDRQQPLPIVHDHRDSQRGEFKP
jgi:hypothetical protein